MRLGPSVRIFSHGSPPGFLHIWLTLLLCQMFGPGRPPPFAAGLQGSDVLCRGDREGQTVQVPRITTANPCFTCRCVGGIVQCEDARRKCPSVTGCYNLEPKSPQECCERCQGCHLHNGTVAASGLTWTDPEDPCTILTCFSGVVTEQRAVCDPIGLRAACPVDGEIMPPQPGHCCPTCRPPPAKRPSNSGDSKNVCELDGVTLAVGEKLAKKSSTVDDPCRECECTTVAGNSGGVITCRRRACPVLACPVNQQVTPAGECCAQCSRTRSRESETRISSRTRCMFHNQLYSAGETFRVDTCTTCTCNTPPASNNGLFSHNLTGAAVPRPTPYCSRVGCAPAYQPAASCRDPDITDRVVLRQHNSEWSSAANACRTCRCTHGEIRCGEPSSCPPCPPGAKAVPPASGECCPGCRKLEAPAPQKQLYHAAPSSPAVTAVGPANDHTANMVTEEGVCTVFGDPHYRTFDGRMFTFQGSCKYLLTRDCGGNMTDSNSTFSIRITNDARNTMAFSWLRTVTVRLAGTKVSLLQKMRVKVDGKKVNLPYIKLGVLSVMQDGFRVILRTNEGAKILWDGVSFLELTVPPKMAGRMCGLCGNFNGDRSDDLVGRRGQSLTSGQEFGTSWRVGGKKACSVLPRDVPAHPPPCREDWSSHIRSVKHCAAINSPLFAVCHDLVRPDYHYRACKMDMCECPGDQCHCEVLTAYARECERNGIKIYRWRDATGCKNVAPFKHSGEHFSSGEATASYYYRQEDEAAESKTTINEVLSFEEEEDLIASLSKATKMTDKPSRRTDFRHQPYQTETSLQTPAQRSSEDDSTSLGMALPAHRNPSVAYMSHHGDMMDVGRHMTGLQHAEMESEAFKQRERAKRKKQERKRRKKQRRRQRQERKKRMRKRRLKEKQRRERERMLTGRGGPYDDLTTEADEIVKQIYSERDSLMPIVVKKDSIGSLNGVKIHRVTTVVDSEEADRGRQGLAGGHSSYTGGGVGRRRRTRLQWGSGSRRRTNNGEYRPPPFEFLLSSSGEMTRQQDGRTRDPSPAGSNEDEAFSGGDYDDSRRDSTVGDHWSDDEDGGRGGEIFDSETDDSDNRDEGSRNNFDALFARLPGGSTGGHMSHLDLDGLIGQRTAAIDAQERTPIPLIESGENFSRGGRLSGRSRSDSAAAALSKAALFSLQSSDSRLDRPHRRGHSSAVNTAPDSVNRRNWKRRRETLT